MISAVVIGIVAESLLLAYSLWRGLRHVQAFIGLNMIAISVFAPLIIEAPIIQGNVGGVYYAFVLLAQAFIIHLWGRRDAIRTVSVVVFVMIGFTVLSGFAALVSDLRDDFVFSTVVDLTFRTEVASVVAFVIANAVLIAICALGRTFPVYVIALFAAQGVDSAVFYPIAFGWETISEAATFALEGVVFKCAITAVSAVPIVLFIHLTQRRV